MKKTTIKDLEKRLEDLEKLVNKPSLNEYLKEKNIQIAPFVPQPPYYPITPNWNPNLWNISLHYHGAIPCANNPCVWA